MQIEEVIVKWDGPPNLDKSKGPVGFRTGVDQNGRKIEVNRREERDSTIHIDGVHRYSCWTSARDPVSILSKMRGMHSFVIKDA